MIKNNRICTLKGHEKYPVFHIGTFLDCDQPTKWCCSECFSIGIHLHNKSNNLHVMSQERLICKITKEYETGKQEYLDKFGPAQQQHLKNILWECQQLEKSLIEYIKYIDKQIKNIISDDDEEKYKEHLCHLNDINFQSLNDQKINELLANNKYKFNQNRKQSLQQPLDRINEQVSYISSIINDYQDNKNENTIEIIDFKDRKYIIQEIDYTNSIYHGSALSKNEQYLAYGQTSKYHLLKIYDIRLQKIIKRIQLENFIYVCQFSEDSSKLFVGSQEGFVYGYDEKHNFMQVFKSKIHSNHIYNILTIENRFLITCSEDKTIIKTDIRTNQQIFQLIGHTSWIIAIDYNSYDDIIVSGSGDKSIKLWDCKNQTMIINKENTHDTYIRQVQLIDKQQNVMSLDYYGNLFKWKIDFIKKALIKLQCYGDQRRIFNFYSINKDQNILLICNEYVKILNSQGKTVLTIEHGSKCQCQFDSRQLDTLNYIHLRANQKIILAIAQK